MVFLNHALLVTPLIFALVKGQTPDLSPRDSHIATFGKIENGSYQVIHFEDGTSEVTAIDTIANTPISLSASARSINRRSCGTGVGCDGFFLN
jgi:hypothetical protein